MLHICVTKPKVCHSRTHKCAYSKGLHAKHTSTQPLWSIHKCVIPKAWMPSTQAVCTQAHNPYDRFTSVRLWQLCVSRAHKHFWRYTIYKHDILISSIAYFMHDNLSSPQIMRTWLYQQFDLLREKRCEVEVMPCYVHPHHLVKPYRKERKDSMFSPYQSCLAKMSQMSLMIWQSG